jgi:ribonuclease P protein component
MRFSDGFLTIFIAENHCDIARLGISISKSCGKAVVRNRLKRLLREAFRQNQDKIPAGFDYVVIPSPDWAVKFNKIQNHKKTIKELRFDEVAASLLKLINTAADRISPKNQ